MLLLLGLAKLSRESNSAMSLIFDNVRCIHGVTADRLRYNERKENNMHSCVDAGEKCEENRRLRHINGSRMGL